MWKLDISKNRKLILYFGHIQKTWRIVWKSPENLKPGMYILVSKWTWGKGLEEILEWPCRCLHLETVHCDNLWISGSMLIILDVGLLMVYLWYIYGISMVISMVYLWLYLQFLISMIIYGISIFTVLGRCCQLSMSVPLDAATRCVVPGVLRRCAIATARDRSRPTITGWWFGTFFIFPYIGNNNPNWLIFFRRVQTTNQIKFD